MPQKAVCLVGPTPGPAGALFKFKSPVSSWNFQLQARELTGASLACVWAHARVFAVPKGPSAFGVQFRQLHEHVTD